MRRPMRRHHDPRLGNPGFRQGGTIGGNSHTLARQIHHGKQRGVAQLADERIDVIIVDIDQMPRACGNDGIVMPQRDQLPVEGVYGIRIVDLTIGIDRGMVRIHTDPQFDGSVLISEAGSFDASHCIGCERCRARSKQGRPS